MWGEVTPAERLRAVTRRAVPDHDLAAEAADALAGFAHEPASLVVACRRVLAHHRCHGPLWWVCARVLGAAEPAAAAREAARLLAADRTADRLGASLPVLDDEALVAAVGWPHAVDVALDERADLDVVALRVDGADPAPALRARRTERTVRIVDAWEPLPARAALVLVEAAAIGGDDAIVPAGTTAALDLLAGASTDVWLVGGVGRMLPHRLFSAVRAACADGTTEVLGLPRVDRVVGPRGAERVADAVARVDCPVVPELLGPLDAR